MIETKGIARMQRWVLGGALAMAATLAAPLAQADSMLLLESGHISGTQSAIYALNAPTAGSLSINLQNLEWPARLSSLSFALATSSGVLQTLSSEGSTSVNISSAGTYYALVTGTAQGHWNIGMYSLSVSFLGSAGPEPSPVPLPGALGLLLSALAGVAGLRGRNRSGKQTVTYAA
jgi:hypothetical protein